MVDDVDLYGINANYAVNKKLDTEVYYFGRERKPRSTGLLATEGPEQTNTIGARGVYTGIKNLTLGLEYAYQFGTHIASGTLYPNELRAAGTPSDISAYAIQAVANYAFPKVKYSPVATLSYTRLSGEKYLNQNHHYNGWSPMYEDQSGGTLYNKILGYSNAELFNITGKMKPMDDVTAELAYSYIKLVNPYAGGANGDANTIYISGVVTDQTYTMRGGKKSLGHEIDLKLTYDYTDDVQFALNTGAFIPGEAFSSKNKQTATQVIGSMKVTF
jgi:hypothetical protein